MDKNLPLAPVKGWPDFTSSTPGASPINAMRWVASDFGKRLGTIVLVIPPISTRHLLPCVVNYLVQEKSHTFSLCHEENHQGPPGVFSPFLVTLIVPYPLSALEGVRG